MACHSYNSRYCGVMTIVVCDMQSEDCEAQCIMWTCLNEVMARHGLKPVNFKGFIVDSAGANWNAVRKIYSSGDPHTMMEDHEQTCLLHWLTSLNRHTDNYIKSEFQEQHRVICEQYKDSKTSTEAEVRYVAIKVWWQSSGTADESSLKQLEQWLASGISAIGNGGRHANGKFHFPHSYMPSCQLFFGFDIQLCPTGPH